MSDYLISARKYRPKSFNEVVGQEVITSTLENAVKNKQLSQALLFTGPRGVGKTSCARILAKMINADKITSESDYSFNIFELDAASNNGVDGIRNLTDQIRIPPQIGNFKVYIIDEVHMLSSSAFNAFLKTLEEPPRHCVFILATTEKHKIIPTILSRCQIYDFKRISVDDISSYLINISKHEKVKYEENAIQFIAKKADGSMRDALQIYDRILSSKNNEVSIANVMESLNILDNQVYFDLLHLIINNEIPKLLVLTNSILARGIQGDILISGLGSFFRDLLVSKDSKSIALFDSDEETKSQFKKASSKIDMDYLIECIEITNNFDINYSKSINQNLLLELTLMKLASLNHNDEKKKFNYKIIPASYFNSSLVIEGKVTKHGENDIKPKLDIKITQLSNSGLSLKSLEKKEENNTISNSIDPEVNLEENPYTEADIIALWEKYSEMMEKKGRFNIASILRIDKPKLLENTIKLTLPNSINKVELGIEKKEILDFIRKNLKNNNVFIDLIVDEKIEKKLVYTDKDKYDLMKKKNPNLQKLKNSFNLSI
ncbi:MAG: DNA polymerase III subunit gamma/tau [Flavobacteriaceae bacterium]|nr:DNA polymerase III subunit gamma/tau [Flavobacteriaceae bacterium]